MKTTLKSILKKLLGPALISFIRRELYRLKAIKYRNPKSPYRQISENDLKTFEPVLSVWRPEGERPIFTLMWILTYWCNYKCPYCFQKSHNRFERYGKYTAHAFDNYRFEKWLEAFSRHFHERRLSLYISGGEPMLDSKKMAPFLKELVSMPTVECIRIDTNVSWKLDEYLEVDPLKIILMCSYHPSQTSLGTFSRKINQLIKSGFKIGMVYLTMNHDNFVIYNDVKKEMSEIGVPLHPGPLWYSDEKYSEEELLFLKKELPEADFNYRAMKKSPYKKKCLFPALAYEMNPFGEIHVGCHPYVSGSFFDHTLLSTFSGPVPCPQKVCTCLHKFSFLDEVNRNINVNPLLVISDSLKEKSGIRKM